MTEFTKMVDGEQTPMTEAEIAAHLDLRTQWQAGQAERDRQTHNQPILAALAALDAKTVRPLRAILSAGGAPDPVDVATLADLRAQTDALRAQLMT